MYDVKSLLVDSGYIYDTSITGGRVGVYQFGQQTLWSNLKVHCLERQNKAMYFDGVDDYVTLTNISTLNIYKRFVDIHSRFNKILEMIRRPSFCL
jgi:syndecan 4